MVSVLSLVVVDVVVVVLVGIVLVDAAAARGESELESLNGTVFFHVPVS
mgnify:CR=1 FL=1